MQITLKLHDYCYKLIRDYSVASHTVIISLDDCRNKIIMLHFWHLKLFLHIEEGTLLLRWEFGYSLLAVTLRTFPY